MSGQFKGAAQEPMRRPCSITHGVHAAVIVLAVVAGAGPLQAQTDVPVQEFTVTRRQLETYARHGQPGEEIRAALGRPLLTECGDGFEVWTYRVDDRRVQLQFHDGKLSLTIFGFMTFEGGLRPC